MAIVPRSQESRRLTPASPVAIGSTSDARLQGEALSALGQGVSQLSGSVQDYQDKVQAQEDAVQTKYVENQLQNLHQTNLKNAEAGSTPDGSNMGELYSTAYDKEAAKIINSASSETVRKNATNFNALLNNDAQTQIQVRSLAKKQGYVYDVMGKNANLVADRIRQNPSEALIAAEYTNFNKQLEDPAFNVLTPEQQIKLKNGTQKLFGEQLVKGFEEKEQYGSALKFLTASQKTPDVFTDIPPNQAAELGLITKDQAAQLSAKGEPYKVATLTGKDIKSSPLSPQLSEISTGMGASDKAQLIDRMQAKLQERTAMRLGDLNAQVNGLERLGLSGQPIDKDGVASLKNEINSNPHLTVDAKARLFDKVNSVVAANSTLQTLKSVPRNQWPAAMAQMDTRINNGAADAASLDPRMKVKSSDFASLADREQHKQIVQRQMAEIEKAQNKDAASAIQSDPVIANLRAATKDGNPAAMDKYVQASLNKQEYLGIPKEFQRVLTKDEARTYANTLSTLPSGNDAGNFMNQLQQQYGPNYHKVFTEITKEDEKLAPLQVAAYVDDAQAKAKMFENVRNQKQINEGITNNPVLKDVDKLITSEVANKMDDFRGIVNAKDSSGSALSVTNAFQTQLNLEVRKRLLNDPNANRPDVIDKAYNDLVSSSYSIVNSTNSNIIIPKAINGQGVDPELVRSFMNVYGKGADTGTRSSFSSGHARTDLGAFNDLSVDAPPEYKTRYGADAKGRFYEDLSRSAKWISNKDQSGISLVWSDPKTGGLHYVNDTSGKPIEKSLSDINLKPGKRVLDYSGKKGLFQ